MYWAMVVAGGLSVVNVLYSPTKSLGAAAFVLLAITLALGGSNVQVEPYTQGAAYVGLDWFILDLIGSTLIFIFIEKLFPLRREQPIFRPNWQTDRQHFAVNHLIVGFILLATNLMIHRFFGWSVSDSIQAGFRVCLSGLSYS
jgi:sterol desaturase/sphingolipid hydroxylase (fatty acid hydroxylase superfamily)